MKKILVEDFEKHGFEVDIIEHCEDEEMLCEIRKNGFFFKLCFDENGEYLKLCEFNDAIFADEVTDFKDLLGRLAKIAYDKLMKENEIIKFVEVDFA